MPTTPLFHIFWIMDQVFPAGLMFPPNGRSKCMERLDAPIGCVQAFLHCRRLQRRNRKKFVRKGCLLFLDWHQQSHGFRCRQDGILIVRLVWLPQTSPCPGTQTTGSATGINQLPRPQPIRSKGTRDHKIAAESSGMCPPQSPRQELCSHAAFVLTMTISQKRQTSYSFSADVKKSLCCNGFSVRRFNPQSLITGKWAGNEWKCQWGYCVHLILITD